MPSLDKNTTAEERKTVAIWLFDNFDEKWKGKDCKSAKKEGKCGSGKCGGK